MSSTSRAARFSSGLSIYDFIKRTSLVKCSPEAFAILGPQTAVLAEAEGLVVRGGDPADRRRVGCIGVAPGQERGRHEREDRR